MPRSFIHQTVRMAQMTLNILLSNITRVDELCFKLCAPDGNGLQSIKYLLTFILTFSGDAEGIRCQ